MRYQSHIYQILIYALITILMLFAAKDNISIFDFHWTRGLVLAFMAAEAFFYIRVYLKERHSKEEKATIMMTAEFVTKALYLLMLSVFCFI